MIKALYAVVVDAAVVRARRLVEVARVIVAHLSRRVQKKDGQATDKSSHRAQSNLVAGLH
jgi:hypothetical protein